MKACRGVGASLTKGEIASWEKEHKAQLDNIALDEFDVLHYAAIAELKKKQNLKQLCPLLRSKAILSLRAMGAL